jgi:hypothetical protein
MYKKMFILFLISFLLLSINTKRSFEEEEKILWKESEKLIWDDFKGKVDTSKINVLAETCWEIKIIESHYNEKVPVFEIGNFFIKNKSWKITNDDYSLAHEQLHFDIAEIFARNIRKSYDSLNKKKIVDVNKYEAIFNHNIESCGKYNTKYDNEVYFNNKKQAFWIKKVGVELARLKKYEYPRPR